MASDAIRSRAEKLAARVYPETYHVQFRAVYADAYERGLRDATEPDAPLDTCTICGGVWREHEISVHAWTPSLKGQPDARVMISASHSSLLGHRAGPWEVVADGE